ncbi:YadA C-terminal domain-containing protein [Enterobacter cloacae complex sp. P47BA]|uniref:YadA C-terminal domain-containing protein n=1 Tax=Enterobacter cloacae complex sp. P47BA TaxID=2779540 RepID=UPI0018729A9E|nr:YadA C-terminal domain-containing protein [Enterobacter cloacae complex sp. P47BA]MBE4832297.1 YadA-like family protein [Enterobacter cloacae complex sp. P47BA]
MNSLNKSAIAVFMFSVVSTGVAEASLTGADLAAANSYFNSHPDIVKYAPWIRDNVIASNTLNDANNTLVSNSYYDQAQGKLIYVTQIGGITPPVSMSTLTPSTPAKVNLAANIPVVVSGNTAVTNTKTTLNEPGLIAAPANTTNANIIITTPTKQSLIVEPPKPVIKTPPLVQKVPVATPVAIPIVKQQIPTPINQGVPSPLPHSIPNKVPPLLTNSTPNKIPVPMAYNVPVKQPTIQPYNVPPKISLPIQQIPNKKPIPVAQPYNVPSKIPTVKTNLMYTPTIPPKAIIQAPVQQIISRNDPIGVQGGVQKLTITVVDSQTPVATTIPAPNTANTSLTSAINANAKADANTNALTTKVDSNTFKADQDRQDQALQDASDKATQAINTGAYAQSLAVDAQTVAAANKAAVANVQSRQQAQETTIQNHSAQLKNHEERITALENESNNNFQNLKDDVDNNRKRAAVGVASVAAMSNIPQVTDSQTFAIGAGAGGYDSQGAVAIGISARVTDHIVTKASVGTGSFGGATYGAGVAFGF